MAERELLNELKWKKRKEMEMVEMESVYVERMTGNKGPLPSHCLGTETKLGRTKPSWR